MICVKLNGGLGNQMFQFACGRYLSYKHQTELVFDVSELNKRIGNTTTRLFELDVFNINTKIICNSELRKLKPLHFRLINTISIKFLKKGIQRPQYFIENGIAYNPEIEKVTKNCFLSGYWQSFYYFELVDALIKKEFTFKNELNEENLDRFNLIKSTNSVSIHIRRTDFLNNKFHDIHGSCSNTYYKNAIELVNSKIENPHFFIFSDDIEWVKENALFSNIEATFIFGNIKEKSYVDMQLMSNCKHNIIANSSFSWWGAWLNGNPDKLVIAPLQWYLKAELNNQTNDLIPQNWIRI